MKPSLHMLFAVTLLSLLHAQVHANPALPTDTPICPARPCILPADCKLIIQPDPTSDPCGCPICGDRPLECSTVLCIQPPCTNPLPPPSGQCCPICPPDPCPIEGQVFQSCGSACPPTCATPHPICTKQCVPGCQCPPGTVLDEVANKCVPLTKCTCPPDCSLEFCGATGKKALCNIPGPREIPGCTGQCQLTFCHACYFSKEVRDLPGQCRACGSPVSSLKCLQRWATCIHWADIKENGKPDPSCITQEKFKCYRYPCELRG